LRLQNNIGVSFYRSLAAQHERAQIYLSLDSNRVCGKQWENDSMF
jgi:hypothetical protein